MSRGFCPGMRRSVLTEGLEKTFREKLRWVSKQMSHFNLGQPLAEDTDIGQGDLLPSTPQGSWTMRRMCDPRSWSLAGPMPRMASRSVSLVGMASVMAAMVRSWSTQ